MNVCLSLWMLKFAKNCLKKLLYFENPRKKKLKIRRKKNIIFQFVEDEMWKIEQLLKVKIEVWRKAPLYSFIYKLIQSMACILKYYLWFVFLSLLDICCILIIICRIWIKTYSNLSIILRLSKRCKWSAFNPDIM